MMLCPGGSLRKCPLKRAGKAKIAVLEKGGIPIAPSSIYFGKPCF